MVAELPKTPVLALMVTGTVKLRHDLAAAEPASRALVRRVVVYIVAVVKARDVVGGGRDEERTGEWWEEREDGAIRSIRSSTRVRYSGGVERREGDLRCDLEIELLLRLSLSWVCCSTHPAQTNQEIRALSPTSFPHSVRSSVPCSGSCVVTAPFRKDGRGDQIVMKHDTFSIEPRDEVSSEIVMMSFLDGR